MLTSSKNKRNPPLKNIPWIYWNWHKRHQTISWWKECFWCVCVFIWTYLGSKWFMENISNAAGEIYSALTTLSSHQKAKNKNYQPMERIILWIKLSHINKCICKAYLNHLHNFRPTKHAEKEFTYSGDDSIDQIILDHLFQNCW